MNFYTKVFKESKLSSTCAVGIILTRCAPQGESTVGFCTWFGPERYDRVRARVCVCVCVWFVCWCNLVVRNIRGTMAIRFRDLFKMFKCLFINFDAFVNPSLKGISHVLKKTSCNALWILSFIHSLQHFYVDTMYYNIDGSYGNYQSSDFLRRLLKFNICREDYQNLIFAAKTIKI